MRKQESMLKRFAKYFPYTAAWNGAAQLMAMAMAKKLKEGTVRLMYDLKAKECAEGLHIFSAPKLDG